MSPTKKSRRCPNGTRRNKKTGLCEPIHEPVPSAIEKTRITPILPDSVSPSAIDESIPYVKTRITPILPDSASPSVIDESIPFVKTRITPILPDSASPSVIDESIPFVKTRITPILPDSASSSAIDQSIPYVKTRITPILPDSASPSAVPVPEEPILKEQEIKLKGRCPKGTRRNKKTGLCEPIASDSVLGLEPSLGLVPVPSLIGPTKGRCPKGTRRNKKTGLCEPIQGNPAEEKELIRLEPEQKSEIIGKPIEESVAVKKIIVEPIEESIVEPVKESVVEPVKESVVKERVEYEIEEPHFEKESLSPEDFMDFPTYPSLDDPMFNLKIAERKEFGDTQYDGDISMDIQKKANIMCNSKFELMPHQLFVKNFLSFQTPYNGLLLYHGLGSGKTCSAIGIAEEMRGYMKQVGIKQRIIVVASPNVQGNFRLQLFDERKLKKIPNPNQMQGIMGTEEDIWDIHSCVGNALLKEINPANVKGLSREKVISQINTIINTYYKFMGYGQFTNYIQDKIMISSAERFTEKERADYEIKNIRRAFNNRLVIIDEVHNIRLTDENNNKKTAVLLMKVAKYSDNMRLLLLSATPMFNSYREIIWITNLLNINDKRSTIEASSVFDKNGNYREGDGTTESGEELLKRKLTGYISYVRGENPFIFPYRIYPNLFSPEHTFSEDTVTYPKKQMNSMEIAEPIKYTRVYLNNCGTYQENVYNAIINNMRNREYMYQTSIGNIRELPSFENMESFGYTMLQTPIEALNMVYPNPEIEKIFGDNVDTNIRAEEYLNTIGKTVGNEGLMNVMKFDDDTKPTIIKHNFKYNTGDYGRIFSPENIGLYSAKIANICNIVKKSKGIVVIYSQYIHGGIIPLALALEEMGFSRFSSTSSHNKNLFHKKERVVTMDSGEKYMMITGDKSYSPSNTEDIKYATSPSNKNGEQVKVILVSKAGSEGLDFKNVRQVHIMEPWYNMNRIEQIIGRGVRNLSHCDLPFEERNVEIYLHSSLLTKNKEEEAVDLYVYRFAEKKAIQIGRVSRTLKESSVDCILNISQTNFTVEKLGEIAENQNIIMKLSSGKTTKFRVGDEPYSSMCDYMETCEFKCSPTMDSDLIGKNKDTYNEYYAKTNNDYIVKKIMALYREKPFYTRNELVQEINRVKIYPIEQIYYALTFLVNSKNEYLVDKYGRIGNLLNKGEYYVFQPIEVSDKNISIYERSAPIDYKRKEVILEIPDSFQEKKKPDIKDVDTAKKSYQSVLEKMIANYNTVFSGTKATIGTGEKNWYKHANNVIENIEIEYSIPRIRLEEYIIYHMLDLMMIDDKMALLNYVLSMARDASKFEDPLLHDRILSVCKKYFEKKVIERNGEHIAFLTKENVSKLYETNNGEWKEVHPEDYKMYQDELIKPLIIPDKQATVNDNIIGFISMFKNKDMVFKIKDVCQKRNNTGARCGDSTAKHDVVSALNLLNNNKEKYDNTMHIGLCVLIEIQLRWYTDSKKDGKIYFFDEEESYMNNIVNLKKASCKNT